MSNPIFLLSQNYNTIDKQSPNSNTSANRASAVKSPPPTIGITPVLEELTDEEILSESSKQSRSKRNQYQKNISNKNIHPWQSDAKPRRQTCSETYQEKLDLKNFQEENRGNAGVNKQTYV